MKKRTLDEYFVVDEDATSGYLYKRLFREYIHEWRFTLVIAILLMMVVAMTAAANAWLIQPALDEIFVNKNKQVLYLIPAAVIIIGIIGGAANYGQTVLMQKLGQGIIIKMQLDMFEHLLRSDLAMFHDQSAGRLISRFSNDIGMMKTTVSNLLTTIAKEFLTAIFLIAIMFYQSWELSLIALLVFPVAFLPVIRLGKRMRKVARTMQGQVGNLTSQLDEIFSVARVVKAYGREDMEVARASDTLNGLLGTIMKAARIQAISSPMMELLGNISIAGIIVYGGLQVIEGETTPGTFFSFIGAMMMAYKPMRAMAGINNQLQTGLAAARRFFAVMDTKPTIVEKPDASALVVDDSNIIFDNVSFSYGDGSDIKAVDGLDLEIPSGNMVALVGASGAGKSTIMNLIMRFYEVSDGSISICGQDIRDVTFNSLRKNIALVSQEIMLFDDTIRANIAYGAESASEEDIIDAAKNSAAHDFITSLPDGYDTRIGPSGARLSGGQRQRISIARAMLKNAPILLLDEATSALDTESERHVQKALQGLMEGRTSLVIAHRLSTILHSDIIYVLDKGSVVESGTHESLIAANGAYANLHAAQFTKD